MAAVSSFSREAVMSYIAKEYKRFERPSEAAVNASGVVSRGHTKSASTSFKGKMTS